MTLWNTRRKFRREFRLETLERREVLAGAVSAPAAGAFVARVYESVLQRAPSSNEVAFWGGLIVKGVSESSVQSGIAGSSEATGHATLSPSLSGNPSGGKMIQNTNSIFNVQTNYIGGTFGVQAFVDGLYYHVLGRAPDASGATYWVNQLESGRLPYNVTKVFVSVADSAGGTFTTTLNGGKLYTNFLGGDVGVQSFVTGLYYDTFGHAPDPAGQAYWVNQLEVGGARPGQVTQAFLTSREFINSGGTV